MQQAIDVAGKEDAFPAQDLENLWRAAKPSGNQNFSFQEPWRLGQIPCKIDIPRDGYRNNLREFCSQRGSCLAEGKFVGVSVPIS